MISKLLKFDIRGALSEVHIRFLLSLFAGIILAILSLARLMNFLLHNHPVPTWSLFFGLIAASIFVVGRKVRGWAGWAGLWFTIGTVAAYYIVGMIPVSTPEELWFIFLSGVIAICAMILPGISGAFILLILGKYEFITGTLKNPFIPDNMLIIIVFCAGCAIGLLGFSRVLNYFLENHYNSALAFLTGLMTGSMQKIWPWKEIIESKIIEGKEYILAYSNVLPNELNTEFYLAVSLSILGFILVIFLERLTMDKS
jgi:putative membrane protein